MRVLTLLHRWTGGFLGLLLMVIGLSGAVLVWEEHWIGVAGADEPFRSDIPALTHALEVAMGIGPGLSRLTFAGEELGLHQAAYDDGSGAYIDQRGTIVARWSSQWERPELWLFDLHHRLFMGETGTAITGVVGLVCGFFVLSGAVIWWRTRRIFRLRPWPARMTRSAIVRQHRDIGIVAAPMLLLLAGTGSLMIFDGLAETLLAPWRDATLAQASPRWNSPNFLHPTRARDWTTVLEEARRQFPEAAFRRVQFPASPDAPIILRLKQSAEWTPNGRTYVRLDETTRQVVGFDDPLAGDTAQSIQEKFYPLHAAKVGGLAWKALVCMTGLVLALLGGLTSFSFWFRGGLKAPLTSRLR